MRKRLAVDRASFIEPCFPSPADQPPSGWFALPVGAFPSWLKFKNPSAPAVKREAEEDWGR
jgi:hypothetical protein